MSYSRQICLLQYKYIILLSYATFNNHEGRGGGMESIGRDRERNDTSQHFELKRPTYK